MTLFEAGILCWLIVMTVFVLIIICTHINPCELDAKLNQKADVHSLTRLSEHLGTRLDRQAGWLNLREEADKFQDRRMDALLEHLKLEYTTSKPAIVRKK